MRGILAAISIGLVFLETSFAATDAPDPGKVLNVVLPQQVEADLAVSGAPPHLREGATLYTFGKRGFMKTREGTNGFTCLLNRDGFLYGNAVFKPTCWDPEGASSYVPVMLRVGELLAAGKSADDVKAEVAAGFRDGTFHRPKRTGVAYMLAGDLVLDTKTGNVLNAAFPGHYMIYAPGVSNADLGYSADARKSDQSLPFIFDGGAGGKELAYLITVPHHSAP